MNGGSGKSTAKTMARWIRNKSARTRRETTRGSRLTFEPLEQRSLLAAGPLLINEILAVNVGVDPGMLADADGDYSDWIEIYNPTSSPISLDGWSLTDDQLDLQKWEFPNVSLDADDYLIVFASGKYPDGPGGELHANFQLEDNGEYLALVRDDGATIAHEFAPSYPKQLRNVSYGLTDTDAVWEELVKSEAELSYHVPTPGEDLLAWTNVGFDDSGWIDSQTVGGGELVISEIETGATNWIEIQNVSHSAVDTAGWFVAINDGSTGDIQAVNATLWNLPGSVAAGDVLHRTEQPGGDYWGREIQWDAGGSGWAMIVDGADGRIVDFLAWGYSEAQIALLSISAGGFDDLMVGTEWRGDGAVVGDGTGGGDPGPEENFVPFGSTWDFLHPLNATNPADMDPDFDNTWMRLAGYDGPAFDASGQGPLGFGDINYAPIVTQIGTPSSGNRYTAYFRREITLTDNLVNAGIEILSDDGAVIYIDGVEVVRNNISGADGYFAFANSAQYPDGASTENRTETLSLPDLSAGTHTIGVSVHQNQTGSSDMAFDMRLFGQPDGAMGSAVKRIGDGDWNSAADFLPTREPTRGVSNPDLAAPFGQIVPTTTGIGYNDNQPDFADVIRTDVAEAMQDVNASLWTRIEFDVVDLPPVDALTLKMKYDDGFVAYLNGVEIARRNAPAALAYNATATAAHGDAQAVVFENIDVTEHIANTLQIGPNVLAIHGLNTSAADGDFLIVAELVANSQMGDALYMITPTPWQVNTSGSMGLVKDTRFSTDRGFYSEPFEVTISTNTLNAEIRYTLDGSLPTATSGTAYTGPIGITTTSTLRAMAFKPGYIPTNVDTHTYIFPEDVADQDGAGFPVGWGSNGRSDYGVDPQIVDDPQYRDQFLEGLTSIPTLSLVLPVADIFGNGTGLYDNPGSTTMEKTTSAEWIYADGSTGFQVDAGLKMQGGASRNENKSPKHSMSLRFRNIHGPGRLSFPLFEDGAVNRFNSLQLRAMYNNSWIHWDSGQRSRGSMIRDQWARDSLLAMGHSDAGDGTYVHLYLNGLYWGVYNVHERQEASHYAEHNGGDDDLLDGLNSGSAIDGSTASWNSLHAMVSNATSGGITPAEFEQIRERLDVVNLIDYMIVNHYGGNADWDSHNWRAAGGGPEDAPWKIYSWDAERILESVSYNRTGQNNAGDPSRLFQNLRDSEEFRILFADRLHKHFFNGGAMTSQNTADRWMDRAEELDLAIVGESARWGDYRRDVHQSSNGPYEFYTKNDHWLPEQQRLINSYFPQRGSVVINQYKSMGLYPSVAAPFFSQYGGDVASGFELEMLPLSGTVYYTLDGSDPRLVGGAISGKATAWDGSAVVLDASVLVKARANSGGTWSALNEAQFYVGPQAAAGNLAVTEINYHPYVPTAEEKAAGFYDADMFEFLELRNIGNQAIGLLDVAFADGIQFDLAGQQNAMLRPGEFLVLAGNPAAFAFRYGETIDVDGQYVGALNNGGEQLVLHDHSGSVIFDIEYNDSGAWPGRSDGKGSGLEILDPTSDGNDAENWRSSSEYGGTPGFIGEGPRRDVLVNEVLSHSESPGVDTIELINTTGATIDLGGWYLSDSSKDLRKYEIPDDTTIAGGGYLLFDESHFNPTPTQPAPNHFGLSSAHGDDVWLIETDDSGNPIRFVDHVEFDAAATGVTFGRWPNAEGYLFPMTEPTLGGANSGPQPGDVVITEIMHNPPGPGEPADPNDFEFVEIYNASAFDADMTAWRLRKGVDFDFGDTTILASGATLVIVTFDPADTSKLAAFRGYYNIDASVAIVGGFSDKLNNEGDRVQLQRPGTPPADEPLFIPHPVEDEVRYDDVAPWPEIPLDTVASLTRRVAGSFGNSAASWEAAAPSPGSYSPAGDAYEPNNTLATAFHPGSDWEQTALSSIGGVAVQTDDDWYRIDVGPNERRLTVDVSFTHAAGNIDVALYDAAGTPVAVAASGSDNERIDTVLGQPGAWYLHVYGANSGNSYDLVWDDQYAHPGDADFSGGTDLSDFNLWNANKFRTNTSWSAGDFNGDGRTDLSDFNIWNAFKFTVAPAPAPVDAILDNAASAESSDAESLSASLAWLSQADLTDSRSNSSQGPTTPESIVDRLLASYWE